MTYTADITDSLLACSSPNTTSQPAETSPARPRPALTAEQLKAIGGVVQQLVRILEIKPSAAVREDCRQMVQRVAKRVRQDPSVWRYEQLLERSEQAEVRLTEARTDYETAKKSFSDAVLGSTPGDLAGLRSAVTLTGEKLALATDEAAILAEATAKEKELARKYLDGAIASSFDMARQECPFPVSVRQSLIDVITGPLAAALQAWTDSREPEIQLAKTRETHRRMGLDLSILVAETSIGIGTNLGADEFAEEFLQALPKV